MANVMQKSVRMKTSIPVKPKSVFNECYPALSKSAKEMLISLLENAVELVREDLIVHTVEIGLVAQHLKLFCNLLDSHHMIVTDQDFDGFAEGMKPAALNLSLMNRLQSGNAEAWEQILSCFG